MTDIIEAMVDIETLDTEETAVVYQVGIIIFKGEDLLLTKEFNLPLQEQIDSGRTISESTLGFHLFNPRGLANSMHNPMKDSLQSLVEFLSNVSKAYQPKYWWSKGDFDYKVLESLLAKVPWQWYQKMELRTLIRECKAEKLEPDHTALKDCLIQLSQLNECRRIIDAAARSEGEEGDLETGTQTDTE